MKVATARKSSVLASNAIHHRIDCLTSFVALLTICGSHVLTDASWLDPVGGAIISAMVVRAGWGNTLSALLELADVSVEDDVKAKVRRTAEKALSGGGAIETDVRDVQGVKSGQNYLVDVEIGVPAAWTVSQLKEVEDTVRESVGGKVRGVRRVKVRFVAQEEGGDVAEKGDFADEFISGDVSPRSSPEPEEAEEERKKAR